jgi:hypothetical protein
MRPVPRPVPLLLAALAAAGCAGASAGAGAPPAARAPDDAAAYFPLAVGNEWRWLDRSPSLPAGEARRRTVRILSRDPEGYYLDSDRGALKVSGPCVQDRLRRILCAPFVPGRAWASVVSVTSTERYEIAGVGERVRVPAGDFDACVRVRARTRAAADAESVLEITYAPGVGPIRIETFAVVGGASSPQVRAELESYRLEGR